ncbi:MULTISPECIES: hypothetical protein [Bacillaceae]|uniref:hypothetical protein n=1 Tax=Bacillaceae TaxID=186817 RepID=UPI00035CD4DD|nr:MULTISPECIES: hypothetical protein [Bacillaceae]
MEALGESLSFIGMVIMLAGILSFFMKRMRRRPGVRRSLYMIAAGLVLTVIGSI